MSATARAFGIARSLAMYYGIPLRARRLRRFYAQFVQPGTLCFDVGAHAGNRVRCWRQLGARVIAIEPQADFVRLLRWLYGRDDGVEIVPLAVGAQPGLRRALGQRAHADGDDAVARMGARRATRSALCARELATRRARRGRDVAVVDRALRRARVRQGRRRRVRGRGAGGAHDTRARAVVRVRARHARDRARLHRSADGTRRRIATTGRSARATGSPASGGSTRRAFARICASYRRSRCRAMSTRCARTLETLRVGCNLYICR